MLNLKEHNKYAIAVLNSNISNWFFKSISAQLGEKAVRHFNIYIEKLPIPKIPLSQQQPFITLVDEILLAKQHNTDTTALETQIDQLVYQLYGLTEEEIKLV